MCRFARSNDAENGGKAKTYYNLTANKKERERAKEQERGTENKENGRKMMCWQSVSGKIFVARILSGFA